MNGFRWLPILALIVSACTPSVASPPTPSPAPFPTATPLPALPEGGQNPYAPREADYLMEQANVYLNTVDLLIKESAPPQIGLTLAGALPTPCHQLRVDVPAPTAEGKIFIEVYSLYKSGQVCVQVLKDFDATIELGVYPPGRYQVYINGEYLGDFSSY